MGRVIKADQGAMELEDEVTRRLKAYVSGEMTWAEVEGMTFEEARAIAQVGCELAAAGRLEEARIIFEGLVGGNPKDSASHAALGTVYQKLGRPQQALAAYDAALSHDDRNPVALGNRGELRLKLGDKAGFADLAQAVQADPLGETAAGRRARALVRAITLKAVQVLQAPAEVTK
jgi:tetratricopeptide (TPR) repeat protein